MKYRHLQLNCLLVLAALLPALVLPCRAMTQPVVSQVSSFEEFMARYHGEDKAGSARAYVAHKPFVCREDMLLDETLGEIELAATAGILVAAGGSLTLDNSKLLVMGPPPVITVEAGGTLCILNWGAMMTDRSMPTDDMIAVEAGGTLHLGNGIALPEGMVADYNVPPNTVLPPVIAPEPEPVPEPDPSPEPPNPPFDLTGEVVKVSPLDEMTVYLTMPRLPDDTKGFCVERSANGNHWTQVLTFGVSTTLHDSIPQWEAAENPLLVTKHSSDGASTFLPYLEQTTNQPFFLRVVLERHSGEIAVSQSAKILLVGGAKPGGDYDDSGGNRGGGSQGKNDRVEQQTPEESPTPPEQEAQTPSPEPQEPTPAQPVAEGSLPLEAGTHSTASWSYSYGDSPLDWSGSSGQAASLASLAEGTGSAAVFGEEDVTQDAAQPPLGTGPSKSAADATGACVSDITAQELAQIAPMPTGEAEQKSLPLGSADRGGAVALASLALFGGVTAVQYRWKKRKQ